MQTFCGTVFAGSPLYRFLTFGGALWHGFCYACAPVKMFHVEHCHTDFILTENLLNRFNLFCKCYGVEKYKDKTGLDIISK